MREHLRPLIAYHLFFTLLASSLLLPAVAWSLTRLLGQFGQPILTNSELLDLLLSPGGVLWLLAAIGTTFLVLYLQQAGMILVAVRPRDNHYRLAFEALWATLRRLPSLSGLVVLQVGSHLLLFVPTVIVLVWLYGVFLGGLDPYYVQKVRPPAFWQFVAIGLPVVGLWIGLAATLYFRWLLALPVMMLENLSPRAALKRSHLLTQGRRRHIALAVLALLVVIIALPVLATTLFGRAFTPMLWWLPERNAVLIPAMLGYLTAYVLLTLAITFVGIAANALLAACLYLRLEHRELRPAAPPADAHPGRLAWAVEVSVILFALFQAWLIVNSFELRDEVAIIAHRGSSMAAPENTLSAMLLALDEKADLIEIDVRLTRDDQVVLYHDRSMSRLTGDPRQLGELSREQLTEFDVGSWFGDAYVGEPIPGLDEALESVRGRGQLMIDLKPDPGRELALVDAVMDTLRREAEAREVCQEDGGTVATCGNRDVIDETLLATMSPSLVREIKAREPAVATTLLAQLILPGTLERRGFDALGLRHNRITDNEIRLARRLDYEIHAWTVNDRARMSQLIDLGVDAIITDRPAALAELLAIRREMSDGALLLVKLRNWLRG
ncbi:glycerophosphodiester phosphodiesterase family protein [Halomonas jincaotanensis]|uniref:glycerophosphodiester phosphodiesterase family protein n=1 Tax=Halomonas jincaotanensis TaxID=2810616 RepID=UPI002022D0B7|nr:glycerophosphodiester phosphodiesterase family protein [Halomonas jincaotanensis]